MYVMLAFSALSEVSFRVVLDVKIASFEGQ